MEDNKTFQAAIRYSTDVYYQRIADAPTSAFIAARRVLSPGFFEQAVFKEQLPIASEKPYRQRSPLTKQRTRLTRLRTRVLSNTPLFFFDELQQKVAENPEYYGVCIISSEGVCSINPGQRLGWIAQQKATARENKFRGW